MDSATIIKSVESVTKKWTNQRKQEEHGQARSRRESLTAYRGPSIKAVAWAVIPEAYLKASDGGKLPAAARQIYYAARKPILETTGRDALNSQYFTQTILPAYVAAHPEETAEWDITYDARGHFTEPHTDIVTPLGTLDARHYLARVGNHAIEPLDAGDFYSERIRRFPTCGPEHRFSAILFVEKEGFLPLFSATELAERYDIAIMSTKGMPVVACRHLADELCGPYGIPLLVLHDFDKAGFSIFGTLNGTNPSATFAEDGTARYEYRHNFQVVDLGLRLTDVEAYSLESEPVQYRERDPQRNLGENGATVEEIKFLCGESRRPPYHGRRVELNAFTSGDFIRWIEANLKANGIRKVVPDAETLQNAYRRALQIEIVRSRLDAIVQEAADQAQQATLPRHLDRLVRKGLKVNPAQPWDQVIAATAAANCKNGAGEPEIQQSKRNRARQRAQILQHQPSARAGGPRAGGAGHDSDLA